MGIPPREPLEPMTVAELVETSGLLQLNQAAVADLAGVDARTARSWFSGERKVPISLAFLLRLLAGTIARDDLLDQVRRRAPNKPKIAPPKSKTPTNKPKAEAAPPSDQGDILALTDMPNKPKG